jgi:catechol 2,3-dioxygenase-like lactoylglutathione lyase family enzyme
LKLDALSIFLRPVLRWTSIWIYCRVALSGMYRAAEEYVRCRGVAWCAKLYHHRCPLPLPLPVRRVAEQDQFAPVLMNIHYQRLNHVTVAVPAGEHEKARAFYSGVLGLAEIHRPDALGDVYDLIWYECLDFLIHLDFTPPWFRPAENRHVALEVADLKAVRAWLESRGAEIREAVVIPDRDRFYVLDPFGNYFELIEMKPV